MMFPLTIQSPTTQRDKNQGAAKMLLFICEMFTTEVKTRARISCVLETNASQHPSGDTLKLLVHLC